jgi:hypothetical protein
MTNLNRPLSRVSKGTVKEAGKVRNIIVILRPPNVIGFRAKGCRKEYQLTIDACYWMAVKAEERAQHKEKLKQKKLKRKERQIK